MNEAEFKAGDYIFHNSFGVGKIIRPAERDGKPGYELDFRDRPGHFMSLDILRRTQKVHPDSLRVFAFERKTEALRLLQEDPAGIVIRAIGQSTAPLERPDIERSLIESALVSGPEQFKIWWGKALPKLKASPWLDISLQGSRVFVRRLETPRAMPAPPPESAPRREEARPTPVARVAPPPRPAPVAAPPPITPPVPPSPTTAPLVNPPSVSPRPVAPQTLPFDVADFRRQLRLIEQAGTPLADEAKDYLLNVASRPNVPISSQFMALLTAYEKEGLSKADLLSRFAEKAEAGIGLEQLDESGIRSDVALLLLEESSLPPVLLNWLSGSFISDLALAELVLDRLVELRQFEIMAKSIEKVTSGLETDLTRLAGELNFVRWMNQKEPNLAALALGNGYPWPPAPLTARITRLLLTLVEMEPRDERSREARKDSMIEVARLLERRSEERDPATITRLSQAFGTARAKGERIVEAFTLLLSQPDRPLVPKLTKYLELNLANLEDSPLVGAMLQLEVGRADRADFGLVFWWLGQAVRLKSLKLARSIFEFLLGRLNRALDETEELRCIMLLSQMVELELISQSQVGPVRNALNDLFKKIANRKVKVDEENGFMLNELVNALNEVIARMEQRLNQALMDKESAEEEMRNLRYSSKPSNQGDLEI